MRCIMVLEVVVISIVLSLMKGGLGFHYILLEFLEESW